MSAWPSHFQPFHALPAGLRGTLALGLADRLEPPVGPGGLLQPSADPVPWPGLLHEIFPVPPGGEAGRFGPDHPFPAAAVIGWARRRVTQAKGRLTVWIGRRVWPYPLILERAGLLGGSLFVDATDNNQRLWAAEIALRCSAVASVTADGSGFGMAATRRLQLISHQSEALMLLARPSCDQRQLSAAGARWRIAAIPGPGGDEAPQWKIELLRCKGVRPISVSRHGQSHPARIRWDAERADTYFIDMDVGHERPRHHPSAMPGAAISGGLSADMAGGPDHAAAGSSRRAG